MNSSSQKKKHGYKYRRSWYLRAIVIDNINGKAVGRGPYHNIRNVDWAIRQFMRTMQDQFPGATHINFYNYKKEFQFQERYQQEVCHKSGKKKLSVGYYDNYLCVTGQSRMYNDILFQQFDH